MSGIYKKVLYFGKGLGSNCFGSDSVSSSYYVFFLKLRTTFKYTYALFSGESVATHNRSEEH
ncbi:MAG: hypothetical protein PHI65_09765, partial [Firmicutes bacterium]|nr:hypothetical protein [Bacillota bacterium]